jgi:hypothetical protein
MLRKQIKEMATEIITMDDLQRFRIQLLNDLKEYLKEIKKESSGLPVEGYKTRHVRKILDCSNGKLQSLRVAGKLRCSKVGGTLYYKREDVQRLLNEGC